MRPGLLQWLRGKEFTCNVGDVGSFPGSGRSPGEENSNPPQYSCLGNPMDRGACRATAHGTAKSWTQLNSYTTTTNLMLIVEKQTTSVKLE